MRAGADQGKLAVAVRQCLRRAGQPVFRLGRVAERAVRADLGTTSNTESRRARRSATARSISTTTSSIPMDPDSLRSSDVALPKSLRAGSTARR